MMQNPNLEPAGSSRITVSAEDMQDANAVLKSLWEGRLLHLWASRGYATFHCLFALSQVGFFEEVSPEAGLDLESFAKRKSLDRDTLDAILKYLYSLGLLTKSWEGKFLLAQEIRKSDLAIIEMLFAYDPVFHNLLPLLRQEKVYGESVRRFDELDVRSTASICREVSYPKVIDQINRRGAATVLDLGCGSAELLIELCKGNPTVRCYGVDASPEAVRYAQRRVRQEKLGERVVIKKMDIFDIHLRNGFPEQPVDLIVSTAVFHEFAFKGDRMLVEALKRVKSAFGDVSVLLVEALEESEESLRENPSAALEHHLFHRLSRQGIASLQTWPSAFAKAGYQIEETVDFPGGKIFALKAAGEGRG